MKGNKLQQGKWPKGVMSPEEIDEKLKVLGLGYMDLKLRIAGVSYDTVRHTIKGRSNNDQVLQYLKDLGINHGRTPSKYKRAS
ncbi:hypothetical protein [Leptospira adleri]|uniref:Transcriptional regulator n=1 Tax=Leptospira adleri TaxID=2023186 RepID=A0A2M9YJA6_9LEPT|nr:hypothetical protein [Leptospira adleri]PJZ51617.1 hypothetical protein CH380_19415 [Leptospira adleri]PJZ61874.1 hypothetical protein CH376_10750 [Leptospira adleri]